MKRTLTAVDVMSKIELTLSPEHSLKQAWESFVQHSISGAPVCSPTEGIVGVLSQNDILYYVTLEDEAHRPQDSYYLAEPFWNSEFFDSALERLSEAQVDDVMSSTVISVRPEDPLSTVAVLMRNNQIHRVLVTEENKVIGAITALELLRVLEMH